MLYKIFSCVVFFSLSFVETNEWNLEILEKYVNDNISVSARSGLDWPIFIQHPPNGQIDVSRNSTYAFFYRIRSVFSVEISHSGFRLCCLGAIQRKTESEFLSRKITLWTMRKPPVSWFFEEKNTYEYVVAGGSDGKWQSSNWVASRENSVCGNVSKECAIRDAAKLMANCILIQTVVVSLIDYFI